MQFSQIVFSSIRSIRLYSSQITRKNQIRMKLQPIIKEIDIRPDGTALIVTGDHQQTFAFHKISRKEMYDIRNELKADESSSEKDLALEVLIQRIYNKHQRMHKPEE